MGSLSFVYMAGEMVFVTTNKRPDTFLRLMTELGPNEFVVAVIEIIFNCPPLLEKKWRASF